MAGPPPTRLEAFLRLMDLRPGDLWRRAAAIASRLGVRGVSRGHLIRLRSGEQKATEDLILLIVMTLRDMTGLPITAGHVFNVEPGWRGASMTTILGHPDPLRGGTRRLSLFSPVHRSPRWGDDMAAQSNHDVSAADRLARLYDEHAALLCANAEFRHRIPPSDVEALVHDVFASYLERNPRVDDPKAYLIAAVNNACMHYWRKRRNETALLPEHEHASDDRTHADIDRWESKLLVAAILARIGRQCRETLRRYYYGEQKPDRIAASLEVTPNYVYQLLHSCRKRARQLYRMLREPKQ